MSPKEYLSRYLEADREINAKLDEISQLRAKITGTGISLNPDKVQTSPPSDTMARIVDKIVDMEKEVDEEIDQLREIKREVYQVIFSLSDERYRAVLRRRYINGKTWEQIAVELHYSYKQVCRIHGKALQKLKDVLECPI